MIKQEVKDEKIIKMLNIDGKPVDYCYDCGRVIDNGKRHEESTKHNVMEYLKRVDLS